MTEQYRAEDTVCIPDDGYTEDGLLLAIPGLHARMSFQFRPTTVTVRAAGIEEIATGRDGAQRERILAKHVAKQIISWDAKNPRTGEILPVCGASVLMLKPRVQIMLSEIVFYGTRASDVEHNDTSTKAAAIDEAQLEADLKKVPVSEAKDGAALGNSNAG